MVAAIGKIAKDTHHKVPKKAGVVTPAPHSTPSPTTPHQLNDKNTVWTESGALRGPWQAAAGMCSLAHEEDGTVVLWYRVGEVFGVLS